MGRLSRAVRPAQESRRINLLVGLCLNLQSRPDTLQTATAHHRGRRKTIVYAVWNGATGVVRWRILAGRSAAKLRPVRTAAWNGLDTAIRIAGAPKQVRVVALDARGSVIAMSKPIRAR